MAQFGFAVTLSSSKRDPRFFNGSIKTLLPHLIRCRGEPGLSLGFRDEAQLVLLDNRSFYLQSCKHEEGKRLPSWSCVFFRNRIFLGGPGTVSMSLRHPSAIRLAAACLLFTVALTMVPEADI